MSSASKWSVASATACVERNGGKVGVKQVSHDTPGLKVLSAIDYLVNHCGYMWVRGE